MIPSYEINEKTVTIKKDCRRCSHIKVCKFHSKMSELCRSNEFYTMNEYSEWCNSLEAFEQHARCGNYIPKFNIVKDSPIGLDIERDILEKMAYAEFKSKFPDGVSQYSIDEKKDTCYCISRLGEKQTFKLSELISEYKFG